MADHTNSLYKNKSTLIDISRTHNAIVNEWQEVSIRLRIICEGLQKALNNDCKKH